MKSRPVVLKLSFQDLPAVHKMRLKLIQTVMKMQLLFLR